MQYTIEDHLLVLNVKPAPILIRGILYLFGGILLIGSLFLFFNYGGTTLIIFLFLCSLFVLGGLYLFKLALWNTYGKEKIYLFKNCIQYRAYYGWYKGKLKTYSLIPNKDFQFKIVPQGYEEDNKGVLHIVAGSGILKCATMLPIKELERIIVELNVSEIEI